MLNKQIIHDCQQLIDLFNHCFSNEYNVRLVRGDDEPIYLPADAAVPYNRIIFAHGFYASALHEIAHWCVAGSERRKQVDFGYWYCPDGRDASMQAQFECVEITPQAFEWMFCCAVGFPFNVSCDNLNGKIEPDRVGFQRKVHASVLRFLAKGIPKRPAAFIKVLREFYNRPELRADHFFYPPDLN